MTALGKYRLIAQLGRGGMADVNLAMVSGPEGSNFTKLAVVKRLRTSLVDDPEFVTMLVDEARISAHLRHPNVVHTLEVSVHEGEPFLAMEYLDGQPLQRLLRRAVKRAISIPREVQYVIIADVLAGLHHAHELMNYDGTPLDVVHRDVTPHNIFITVDGQVKVVDFGIAKAAGRAAVTQQGIVKGKLRYMSPEQAGGGVIERGSDLFSVGIILWEAATGKRFWENVDDVVIGGALVAGTYEASPRQVDATVPEGIDAICRKALALDPKDRYATAADFRADIEKFLGDEIIRARRQIGPLVTMLSEEDRRKLRSVIEAAASEHLSNGTPLETGSVKPFVVSSKPSDNPPSDEVGVTKVMPETVQRSLLEKQARERNAERAARERRNRNLLLAGLGIAAVAAIFFTVEAVRAPSRTASAAVSSQPSSVHASLSVDSEGVRRAEPSTPPAESVRRESPAEPGPVTPAPATPRVATRTPTPVATPAPVRPTWTPPPRKPPPKPPLKKPGELTLDTSDPWKAK